jgi:ribosomal RNA-processing protein 17
MSFKSKSKAPAKSNVALLTEGASYIRRAKNARKGEPAVEKVVFDDDARREYLTGFSKRKKAKVQEKRDRATKKAHEDHLAQRRQVSFRVVDGGGCTDGFV